MSPDFDRIPGLIVKLEARIAALPRFNGIVDADGLDALHAAVSDLCTELTEYPEFGGEGAAIERGSDGVRVALAGIRAHSTMGEVGALQNWITAAKRRLELRAAS